MKASPERACKVGTNKLPLGCFQFPSMKASPERACKCDRRVLGRLLCSTLNEGKPGKGLQVHNPPSRGLHERPSMKASPERACKRTRKASRLPTYYPLNEGKPGKGLQVELCSRNRCGVVVTALNEGKPGKGLQVPSDSRALHLQLSIATRALVRLVPELCPPK